MKDRKIINFRDITGGLSGNSSERSFAITYLREDGVLWEHLFPYSFFSWRCAEYGIDPGDTEALIDMLLHEQHIDIGPHDPNFLYNTDEGTARENHFAKVQASKKNISYSDPENHLQKLRDFHLANHDPVSTEVKRRRVRAMRIHRMITLAKRTGS